MRSKKYSRIQLFLFLCSFILWYLFLVFWVGCFFIFISRLLIVCFLLTRMMKIYFFLGPSV